MASTTTVEVARNAARRLARAADLLDRAAPEIAAAADAIGETLAAGGKILVFGNGGSAACAQHFAAEFTGKLSLDRRPLPAVALSTDTSALTAIANDYGYEDVFARQVRALGRPGDVAVGLSTSGSSRNVLAALEAAAEIGMTTVVLAGARTGADVDHAVLVPIGETARIQEAHDVVLHTFAGVAERIAVPDMPDDKSFDRFPFVLGEDDLAPLAQWLRESGQTLVTTNGVFDLLHRGHRASLSAAAALGDRLVVLVNADDSVRALKGEHRPIRPLADRFADLADVAVVDHVVEMPDADPVRLLTLLRPDVHAKGADYRGRGIIEEATVVDGGGTVAYLDLVEGYSTTEQERIIDLGEAP